MKKITSLFATFLLIAMFSQGTQAFAEETEKIDYNALVKEMIANYDATEKFKDEQASQDDRFVNEMVISQEESEENLEDLFEEAEQKGEKFYSSDEILASNADEFGISQEDMDTIKGQVLNQKTDLENLVKGFENLNQSNHPIAKNLEEELNQKIPKSAIYIDHSVDSEDGKISGGGWPYCLDDNGYGPGNFVTSDCYKAIKLYYICASDSTLGKMDSSLRYCKAYKKNCSPLIGHSKYNHTHKWYEKLP
ncbi:hypothetical protein [Priestia endophytica]|uniref:hypothetical protein n=1 Tax=Priestia endophytica TaxID=135735 RepID=UPI002E1B3E9F|nr:hypothetical protein [Priestia endophytica]